MPTENNRSQKFWNKWFEEKEIDRLKQENAELEEIVKTLEEANTKIHEELLRNKTNYGRLQKEYTELKKQLEEMDLIKLCKNLSFKYPKATFDILMDFELYEYSMLLQDHKSKTIVATTANNLKEAIKAFRKKLGEMK